jgi:hypothetical protein
MFPKALILFLGTSGAKARHYPCSYSFLLIHLCRNVTVRFYLCFTRQMRWFCEKKLTKKIIFYCDYEALKVVRIYRCHPVFVPQLSRERRRSEVFVPQLSKERRRNEVVVPQLSKERRRSEVFVSQLSKERRRSEVFVSQLSKERRRSEVFVSQLSKERRRSKVFVPQLSMVCHCKYRSCKSFCKCTGIPINEVY